MALECDFCIGTELRNCVNMEQEADIFTQLCPQWRFSTRKRHFIENCEHGSIGLRRMRELGLDETPSRALAWPPAGECVAPCFKSNDGVTSRRENTFSACERQAVALCTTSTLRVGAVLTRRHERWLRHVCVPLNVETGGAIWRSPLPRLERPLIFSALHITAERVASR